MSIRIMMWNIQKFSITKFDAPHFIGRGLDKRVHPDYGSHLRWDHILSTISEVDPDILVLIEVGSGGANCGAIAAGGAAAGVLQLLGGLQTNGFADMRVVPPIVSGLGGSREGIAVFFKSSKLRFTGPWMWGIDYGRTEMAAPQNARNFDAHPYDGVWTNVLPTANNQNLLAAQWLFADALATFPPRETTSYFFPSMGNRSLCLTTFHDISGNRQISVFSMHSPASRILAGLALNTIARIRELRLDPRDTEVQVLVGDFNVNALDPLQVHSFDALQRNWYIDSNLSRRSRIPFVLHNTTEPTVLNGVTPRRTYTGLSFRGTARIAAPVNQAQLPGPYYGYVGKGDFGRGEMLALDNMLTRYGTGIQRPGNHHFEVANTVFQTGTCTPDLGGETITDMLTKFNIGHMNPQTSQANRYFRQYSARFGKIGALIGASDHMALVIDV